ncbi:Phosphoribulokinase/uridine kinase [Cynara cardunculus var. scolymus]|uniref:Phosphoribulokinase/uridine kinase n=1 Tax=Cynara cardunculus var. scolymus TaxID=59895 RepID=A0A118JWS8_CYNCS|nr:Phosphoribulokinase/uridine kinase [Cynara cardunculus var. scolymus]
MYVLLFFLEGVARGAASGKTTVCDMIIEQLHDQRVVLVNQDSFYHNLTAEELTRVHEYNFDHPGKFYAFDNDKLLSAMEMLKHGEAVDIPKYNFRSYKNNVSRRGTQTRFNTSCYFCDCRRGLPIWYWTVCGPGLPVAIAK